MTAPTRAIGAVLLTAAWTTGFGFTAAGQAPAPAPAPQGQTAAPGGRGPGQGAETPAAPARGRQGAPAGARRGGYTQFTRPLASQDVIVRGKAVYETNCASCHAVDMRGTADGKYPNLLRSGVTLRDQQGALVGDRLTKHAPPINLVQADTLAVRCAGELLVEAPRHAQEKPAAVVPRALPLLARTLLRRRVPDGVWSRHDPSVAPSEGQNPSFRPDSHGASRAREP